MRCLTLTEGLNRSMLFWENDTTSQPRQYDTARGETLFDISKIGPTGPFGGAAYLQAHLPDTQQEHDQVSQAWAKRSSVVVEELSCFAPVRLVFFLRQRAVRTRSVLVARD